MAQRCTYCGRTRKQHYDKDGKYKACVDIQSLKRRAAKGGEMSDLEKLLEDVAQEAQLPHIHDICPKEEAREVYAVLTRRLLPLLEAGQAMHDAAQRAWDVALRAAKGEK